MNVVCPPGGVGVQPSVDAGSRQTAAGGEGERGGPEPPETGAEAPSNSRHRELKKSSVLEAEAQDALTRGSMLTSVCVCVQLFQAEQRLQRSQRQLKDLQQAAADASPESKRPGFTPPCRDDGGHERGRLVPHQSPTFTVEML